MAGVAKETSDQLSESIVIVLRKISLDAWNNHQDKKTAQQACNLALTLALDTDTKARLVEDLRILAAQETKSPVSFGCLIWIAIIGFILIASMCSEKSNTGSSSRKSRSATTTYTSAPPSPASSNSEGGRYRVSSYVSSELDRERAAIETAKADAQVLANQLDTLETAIEAERLYVDNRSQVSVDTFNRKVNRHNELLQTQKAKNDKINQMIDAYNSKLKRHSR